MKSEYKIRKLSKYYVVQELRRGWVLKSFSLNPKKIFMLLKENKGQKMKETMREVKSIKGQKGAQDLLGELYNPRIPTKEEIRKSLKEISKPHDEIRKAGNKLRRMR